MYTKTEVVRSKSAKPEKRKAVIDGRKTVHFGRKWASDYRLHKDDERKDRYISRHRKNGN